MLSFNRSFAGSVTPTPIQRHRALEPSSPARARARIQTSAGERKSIVRTGRSRVPHIDHRRKRRGRARRFCASAKGSSGGGGGGRVDRKKTEFLRGVNRYRQLSTRRGSLSRSQRAAIAASTSRVYTIYVCLPPRVHHSVQLRTRVSGLFFFE